MGDKSNSYQVNSDTLNLQNVSGIKWEATNMKNLSPLVTRITYGNGLFVSVGGFGQIAYSKDGVNWTSKYACMETLYGIVFNGTNFIAVGENGTVITSTDGVNWEKPIGQILTILRSNLSSITWGLNQYVAVGDSGKIFTSKDGINWDEKVSGTTSDLTNILWNGSQFICVGYDGTILTSQDAVSWTKRTSGSTMPLRNVAWNGSTFLAVGDGGTVVTSQDEENWSISTLGANGLADVISVGKRFFVISMEGEIQTSLDGIAWGKVENSLPNELYLRACLWSDGKIILVGLFDHGGIKVGTFLSTTPAP